ncbi:MAG: preprotein translocase subunit SecG [Chloroflexi bacterium]|nr:preprotein translocase subunit SecG [Chloroflexota bacterium]
MSLYLHVAQILVSVLLVSVILLQIRGEGGGLFAAGSATYRVRRGVEKVLFQLTIVLSALFILISILSVRLAL